MNNEINEINLKGDLSGHCQQIFYNYSINNTDLNLSLTSYNDIGIIDILYKWQSCFGLLGKGNMFHSKDISKTIYCLLTDSCILTSIDNDKVDIDLFNTITNRFYQINVLTKARRKIKLKIFPICDTLIIIDWKNFPNYKIYELFNIGLVKEYYKNKKVIFDTIIKDIKLKPKYSGNVNELTNDFKILSVNKIIIDKEKNIENLENFLSAYASLEKQIQREYKRLTNHT